MKILMAHNRYQNRGGEDESFDSESSLLERYGHRVIRYVKHNDSISEDSIFNVAVRTLWSVEDYKSIRALIQREKPSLLHVQNHFPLISPAIYYAAKKEKIPVIQTLRNYRLFCLNAYFFRQGRVCEKCLGQAAPLSGIQHKCYRNSRAGSIVVSSSIALHRLIKTYVRKVDLFIALTEFAKQKYADNGIPRDKIVLKSNFVDPDPKIGTGNDNFVLFVGRLSPEKGISTLLRAWKQLGNHISLHIIGSGPLEPEVRKATTTHLGIEYLGPRPVQEVQEIMGQAKALIFPSLWYEGMPRVIIEAFAKGTPVISSKLGAMTTMVTHQKTGLHFCVGNAEELVKQIRWMIEHPSQWQEMRLLARQKFEVNYNAESSYHRLIEIYNQAISAPK
ncbi:MAG: glycosyltransferase [Cyanobacteria bacterium P01_B01_bin.77]